MGFVYSPCMLGRILLALVLVTATARADDGLTTIDNQGGGQIVYGPLTGANSLQAGVATVLRNVHAHFGDRPQLGRVMRARDNRSVAAFFTVNAKQVAIAGVVIVSMPDGNSPAAAVLYDDASRFRRTGGAMMQKLLEVWRATAKVVTDTSPEALVMVTSGDRSAGISIPTSWKLTAPVNHGRLSAAGPNGEAIDRGLLFHAIHDQGIPRTGDLFDAFVAVTNEDRRRQRQAEGSYKVVEKHEVPHAKLEARAIQVAFEVDFHDGRGTRSGTARIASFFVRGAPTWDLSVDVSTLPTTIATAEASMMQEINASFAQDAGVIKRESEASLQRSRKAAGEHKARMAAHMKQLDAHARAFDAHMDNMDRYGKSFQNYIFDRSELQDNDRKERGAIDAGDADALVKADPERFQIVPQADFAKGVDY